MTENKIYKMKFKEIYDLYVAKVERKGRTKAEVDETIYWLTGYDSEGLETKIKESVNMEDFFNAAPSLNPNRNLITGSICGVKISEIREPVMKEIRFLDKLVDEISKGKSMNKVLRNIP